MTNENTVSVSEGRTKSYSNLRTFYLNICPVRVMERESEIWFVSEDICKVMRHTNFNKAVERLDEDEKAIFTNGSDDLNHRLTYGSQPRLFISESGFYSLVSHSRKERAKMVKQWVKRMVMPAIRKHGSSEAQIEAKPADN